MNSNAQTASDGVKVKLLTIKELSEFLELDYVRVSGFVNTLVSLKVIKQVGTKSAEGKRGKPSGVFEIPQALELVFWQDKDETVPEIAPESAPESVQVIS
jgi:hypothetical protein